MSTTLAKDFEGSRRSEFLNCWRMFFVALVLGSMLHTGLTQSTHLTRFPETSKESLESTTTDDKSITINSPTIPVESGHSTTRATSTVPRDSAEKFGGNQGSTDVHRELENKSSESLKAESRNIYRSTTGIPYQSVIPSTEHLEKVSQDSRRNFETFESGGTSEEKGKVTQSHVSVRDKIIEDKTTGTSFGITTSSNPPENKLAENSGGLRVKFGYIEPSTVSSGVTKGNDNNPSAHSYTHSSHSSTTKPFVTSYISHSEIIAATATRGHTVNNPTGYPYPSSESTYPSSGSTYPSSGSTHPSSGSTYPSSGSTYPSSGSTYPSSGSTYPSSVSGESKVSTERNYERSERTTTSSDLDKDETFERISVTSKPNMEQHRTTMQTTSIRSTKSSISVSTTAEVGHTPVTSSGSVSTTAEMGHTPVTSPGSVSTTAEMGHRPVTSPGSVSTTAEVGHTTVTERSHNMIDEKSSHISGRVDSSVGVASGSVSSLKSLEIHEKGQSDLIQGHISSRNIPAVSVTDAPESMSSIQSSDGGKESVHYTTVPVTTTWGQLDEPSHTTDLDSDLIQITVNPPVPGYNTAFTISTSEHTDEWSEDVTTTENPHSEFNSKQLSDSNEWSTVIFTTATPTVEVSRENLKRVEESGGWLSETERKQMRSNIHKFSRDVAETLLTKEMENFVADGGVSDLDGAGIPLVSSKRKQAQYDKVNQNKVNQNSAKSINSKKPTETTSEPFTIANSAEGINGTFSVSNGTSRLVEVEATSEGEGHEVDSTGQPVPDGMMIYLNRSSTQPDHSQPPPERSELRVVMRSQDGSDDDDDDDDDDDNENDDDNDDRNGFMRFNNINRKSLSPEDRFELEMSILSGLADKYSHLVKKMRRQSASNSVWNVRVDDSKSDAGFGITSNINQDDDEDDDNEDDDDDDDEGDVLSDLLSVLKAADSSDVGSTTANGTTRSNRVRRDLSRRQNLKSEKDNYAITASASDLTSSTKEKRFSVGAKGGVEQTGSERYFEEDDDDIEDDDDDLEDDETDIVVDDEISSHVKRDNYDEYKAAIKKMIDNMEEKVYNRAVKFLKDNQKCPDVKTATTENPTTTAKTTVSGG